MAKIVDGEISVLFAFDVGFEVSLEKLTSLFNAAAVEPLSHKKQTPMSLNYSILPRTIDLGETEPLITRKGHVQATAFHFGAISVAYKWSLSSEESGLMLDDLPDLSQKLQSRNLEEDATARVKSLIERINAAIVRPELSSLVEDYYLFVIKKFDKPIKADDLLSESKSTIGQILRFETLPLNSQQHEDAISHRYSYYEDDLAVIDWNAALIYDRDYKDTARVLELLNVELLEARYVDSQLDRRIGDYEAFVLTRSEKLIPLRTPFKKAIQELAEMRIESLLLTERVNNALKLVGDLYLARVHASASKRFYLNEWETAISRKLDIIDDLYDLLVDRARTSQSQTLELIVVFLILTEIVMAILRH